VSKQTKKIREAKKKNGKETYQSSRQDRSLGRIPQRRREKGREQLRSFRPERTRQQGRRLKSVGAQLGIIVVQHGQEQRREQIGCRAQEQIKMRSEDQATR
jgi:hypothetical protein